MSEEERNYTEEAERQGWSPDGPLDAQAFVEKGERIAGVVKKHNTELKGRIERLEASNREFGQYQSKLLKAEKDKSAQLLGELEVARATAINDGDGQEFNRLDKQIAETRNRINEPDPSTISEVEWGKMTEAWVTDNSWYNTDQKLQTYANGLADKITGEGYVGAGYYSELTRRVKEAFPENFSNPNQTGPNSVESGGTQKTEKTEEHSYDNLDAEAKAACDRFVTDGLTTPEEFVENYDW